VPLLALGVPPPKREDLLANHAAIPTPQAFVPARTNGNNGKQSVEKFGQFLSEEQFRDMLCRERKRSERSKKPLLLMLVTGKEKNRTKEDAAVFQRVAGRLSENVRETDLAGWFEKDIVFGVVFTELGQTETKAATNVIQAKVTEGLQKEFDESQLKNILVSFYAFPDGWTHTGNSNGNGNGTGKKNSLNSALYPDLVEIEKKKRLSLVTKRAMDIAGSFVALVILLVPFGVFAFLIKLTSKGPVLFRQERIGQYGVPFKFLKFRSMRVTSDSGIHQEYVKKFIAGKVGPEDPGGKAGTAFKITNDPRVTWIGKFMRRASIDELPQFWNVLMGEMSLVGPRPPIPYETEAYDTWHRRRLVEIKPGITGLWQVQGRSRTTFDDMVRLDLRYSKTWTPLLDARILLQTPRAVISGDGAY
jgi:lipopolysaccharide/colanic/teichoic acid biosynthesis glycosyltransferase